MGVRQHHTDYEESFLQLPFAEQFLIWAARVWLAATAQGRRVPAVLQEGLCAAGVPEAWESLDAMLWMLCRYTKRAPDFHGIRCLCVGRDEHMLIRAVAAAQHGDGAAIRRELETLLPAEVACAAATRLEDVGHVFLCAGLRLGGPICTSERGARMPVRQYGAGSRSVH